LGFQNAIPAHLNIGLALFSSQLNQLRPCKLEVLVLGMLVWIAAQTLMMMMMMMMLAT